MSARPARPAGLAQDKLALLLSLVPYLLDHQGVTVAEAAAHFGVSPQELRDRVERLTGLGVPGSTATYGPEDLFDIDWDAFDDTGEIYLSNPVDVAEAPKLAAREASALMAGLQYLQTLPGHSDHETLAALLAKLGRGAAATPPAVVIGSSETDAALQLARQALERGIRLEFDYLNSRGERERRQVDPLRLESRDDSWYLRAWCHLRDDLRVFRLDRMSELTAVAVPVEHTPDEVGDADTLFETSDDDLVVEVRIATSAVPVLGEYLTPDAKRRPDGAGFERASIRVAHFHGLKRLVAGLPGLVTVVAPAEARAAAARWAAEGLQRYESPRSEER